jgi:hypothetical protein
MESNSEHFPTLDNSAALKDCELWYSVSLHYICLEENYISWLSYTTISEVKRANQHLIQ